MTYSPTKDGSYGRILDKVRALCYNFDAFLIVLASNTTIIQLREKFDHKDVELLEELFIQEGIFFDPHSVVEMDSAYEDLTLRTILSLQQAVRELTSLVEKVRIPN